MSREVLEGIGLGAFGGVLASLIFMSQGLLSLEGAALVTLGFIVIVATVAHMVVGRATAKGVALVILVLIAIIAFVSSGGAGL